MQTELYKKIEDFSKKLAYLKNIDEALDAISEEAKSLLHAQRCSIFLVDHRSDVLWTKLSNDVGKIAIGLDAGIVGLTYETRKPQLVNEPYKHPRFLNVIDKQSGYKTKNLITMPIFADDQEIIGIIQLLNKVDDEEGFNQDDKYALTFFANYVSGTLELALKL
jgi:signal transduction protein with GAF and PtsI domain